MESVCQELSCGHDRSDCSVDGHSDEAFSEVGSVPRLIPLGDQSFAACAELSKLGLSTGQAHSFSLGTIGRINARGALVAANGWRVAFVNLASV
jgi:hypothetical protein